MAKIYLIQRRDDRTPIALEPTKAKAKAEMKAICDAECDLEIIEEDITLTREGVCRYINDRFGIAIFEN